MSKHPAVYIVTNQRNGTLYIGVTAFLLSRIHQHRDGLVPGFSREHGLRTLVWFEFHADMPSAIGREKQIKEWRRSWKLRLIESANPYWRDLWPELVG